VQRYEWVDILAVWGKILGGAAGLAVGGPIGAVIGAVAGHAYDRFRADHTQPRLKHKKRSRKGRSRHGAKLETIVNDPTETRQIAFSTAVVVLGAKLAKSDGRVNEAEIRAFKRAFRIGDEQVGDVARIYNQAKASPEGFEPYARQVAALMGHDPFVLEELLTGLFEVAKADGEPNVAEIHFLRRVGAIFGFTGGAFDQIRARHSASSGTLKNARDAYAVLGLTRSASNDEIKQTYRKLVREHHPDQLVAKGLNEEFVGRANDRLAVINAAYDRLRRERRFK